MAARCSVDVGGTYSRGKMAHSFRSLTGIRVLAESGRFKGWLLDQFGVLHDGKKPYPGAISTLENLANHGAKMVVISNSSRRASTTIEKLKDLGFDPSLFLGAITSGELTHQYLQRRDDPWFLELGRCCVHMTWCDRGALAEKYEKLGGEVKWMGKPDKIIYKSALVMAGLDSYDCVAIGDSLHHDIKGANNAGIESVLITGGIHAAELGLAGFTESPDTELVQALASKYNAHPSYVLPSFLW